MKKIKSLKNRKLKKLDNGATGSVVPGLSTTTDLTMQKMLAQLQSQQLAAKLGGAITGGLLFAGSMVNSFGKPLFTTQLATTQTTGPLSYLSTSNVDSATEMSNLSKSNTANTMSDTAQGASLGMTVGGPIGAGVGAVVGLAGGLFGGAARKRKMRNMINTKNQATQDANDYNRAGAQSTLMLTQFANKYGDTQDDNLYNDGKVGADDANALVGKGETIVDGNNGNLEPVNQGSAVGTDDVPADVQPQDSVAGNKMNPFTGRTFAQDMAPLSKMEKKLNRNADRNVSVIAKNTADMVKRYTLPMTQLILAQLKMVLDKNNSKQLYADGKNSDLSTYLGAGLNTLTGLAPSIYNYFKGLEKPELVTPESLYSTNPYQGLILSTLAARKYNVNPELDAINSSEARARYNTRQLGNESGINRAMDVENNVLTQKATADAYYRKQTTDNSYRGDLANAMMNLGSQQSQMLTQAMQSARDINARNRASKNAFTSAALEGTSSYMLNSQKTANENNMNMFQMGLMNKMYELYHKDQLSKQPAQAATTNPYGTPAFNGFTGTGPLNYTLPTTSKANFTQFNPMPTNYNWSGMDLSQYSNPVQSTPITPSQYLWSGMNLNNYK